MLAHLLTTLAKLLGPGGAKAIVADSLLTKQQLLIINRSRRRAPNLTPIDRMLLGLWTLFLRPHHIQRAAVILRPSTLLNFHDMLKKRKYRLGIDKLTYAPLHILDNLPSMSPLHISKTQRLAILESVSSWQKPNDVRDGIDCRQLRVHPRNVAPVGRI